MDADLIVAPEAERDLNEAYTWYEGRRVGLGEDFLGCVDACIRSVLRSPETRAVIFDGYRRALVRRFPYAVIFESSDNTVTVYGVFHNASDPAKWKQRLP